MSKVVNLRTARKQRRRDADRKAVAQEETAQGAQAARSRAENALEAARHEGHRRPEREPPPET